MIKPVLTAGLFPLTLAIASCSSAQSGDSAPAASTPAPASSAMVSGEPVRLAAGSPFVASSHGKFAEPWAIAVHPQSGVLFIPEKRGTMKFYDPASGRSGTVTGLPKVAYGGQGGLGDFAFAPDFAQSGMVYVTWAASAPTSSAPDARKAVAGRGKLVCDAADACRIEGLTKIWEQTPAIASAGHFSHKLAFSPNGAYLFISSGERMQGAPAQDLTNNLGSVVRLLPDGRPAPGNPFADRSAPANQVWTYGQRNILGLKFDPAGELWGLEHGPKGGDELNHLVPGSNYGWPVRSNGDGYDGAPIPDHTADDGFTKPAISWNPVIAPGDFLFYTGAMWPQWRGQALIANLGTKSISRVAVAAGNASATEEKRYAFPERLRDIAQARDGSLWVIEDGEGGRLLHLLPAPA